MRWGGRRWRGVAGTVAGGEGDRALLRAVQSRDAVEDAGLPGAVGPDQGEELASADLHGEAGERRDAAEAKGEGVEFEDGGWSVDGAPARAMGDGTIPIVIRDGFVRGYVGGDSTLTVTDAVALRFS